MIGQAASASFKTSQEHAPGERCSDGEEAHQRLSGLAALNVDLAVARLCRYIQHGEARREPNPAKKAPEKDAEKHHRKQSDEVEVGLFLDLPRNMWKLDHRIVQKTLATQNQVLDTSSIPQGNRQRLP